MNRSRALAGFAAAFLVSACSVDLGFSPDAPKAGAFVVGDEPYAVKAGAAIMTQGGNAVDAVTATYFALSVTYPVAAGLGGGGICLVHDPATGRNEEFDFLARSSAGGGGFAVAGNVRGFALMQTAYGALPWQRVISPAEGYASAGFRISHALATRLAATADVVRLDAGLAAEFLDESGHVKPDGSVAVNRELAETLSAIRAQGADALYTGAIGQAISAYSVAQNSTIAPEELAAYKPARAMPHVIRLGDEYVFLPGQGTGAGAFAGTLFDNLVRALGTNAGATNTEAAVVVATKQTLSGYAVADLPNDLGATGFAATDNNGQAVACAVTMNGPFGSGHTAPGTGVALARAPSASTAGLAAAFLTPVLATDGSGLLSLAGAGAGGPIGSASIADALARLSKGETVTRRSKNSAADTALYDTVNAILCQDGACTALPDASVSGLGAAPGE